MAWFESRLPQADTSTLTQRNIYIVPTASGWAFGAMLIVLLLASINYQLSLGFALTFLLAGSAIVSMHMTHGTLRGLTLHLRPVTPVFAGQPARLEVVLTNPGRARHGIGLAFRDRRTFGPGLSWIDVPALGQQAAQLALTPDRRGWHGVPALTAETRFPFGLFRAWTVWRPAARVLAWPRLEHPAPPLPPSPADGAEAALAQRTAGGEFDGVRAWRREDSMRQIVWKKAARTGTLVSRDTSASTRRELWLDWAAARTASGDPEERLSRLAAWVVSANRLGLPCALRLPALEVPPGQGDAHRRQLLEALALWD